MELKPPEYQFYLVGDICYKQKGKWSSPLQESNYFQGLVWMEAILALSQYLHKQVRRLKGTDLLMSSSEVPKCDFKNKSECVINWLLLIQSFALSDFEIT